jgi:hypothetical protein
MTIRQKATVSGRWRGRDTVPGTQRPGSTFGRSLLASNKMSLRQTNESSCRRRVTVGFCYLPHEIFAQAGGDANHAIAGTDFFSNWRTTSGHSSHVQSTITPRKTAFLRTSRLGSQIKKGKAKEISRKHTRTKEANAADSDRSYAASVHLSFMLMIARELK